MSDITFEICSTTDLVATHNLAVTMSVEGNTQAPTLETYAGAVDRQEILIGKDGFVVVAFCIFHQEGNEIVNSYVVVHADYRQRGIAVTLRAACIAEWASRGATHETSRIPEQSEWLNTQLTQRGAIFLRTEENNGRTFNVYRREW